MAFPTDVSRRRALQMAAAGLILGPVSGAGFAAAQGVEAVGQPMPRGVSLPATPPAAPDADSVGIAIIGLGGYALRQMMPAISRTRSCHVAGLVSGNREKALEVGRAYGVPEDAIYGYEGFDAIAADDRIDAVYVVLPSGLHTQWTEKAFAAGKHVLCEKPMALSVAECDRMIAASERTGRKLMIGYRCHFEPYNLAAMDLMRSGAVGDIEWIGSKHQYTMGPTSPAQNWRAARALAGGGPLEDYGLYGVQAALYLTGEMPVRISATTTIPTNDPRFAEIFATVESRLEFPSGAVAELATSYDAQGANEALVRGTGGELIMRPATSYGGQAITLVRDGVSEPLTPGDPSTQFHLMMDHFASAVRSDTPILADGAMGRRDLRIIEATYLAAETGSPVTL